MMNQELFNRIFHIAQSIVNQYMFEPADSRTENEITTRIAAQLSQLHTAREIQNFGVQVEAEGTTLNVDIFYKQPNIANVITINLSIGPTMSQGDRFDRAMKGV